MKLGITLSGGFNRFELLQGINILSSDSPNHGYNETRDVGY